MKRKVFSVLLILVVCMILGLFSVSASAQTMEGFTETEDDSIVISDLCAVVDGQKIFPSTIDGEQYLFLPSSTDLSAVKLLFRLSDDAMLTIYDGVYSDEIKSGDAINVADISLDKTTNTRSLVFRAVRINAGEQLLAYSQTVIQIMKSEGIASMYINAGDPAYARAWIDETKQDAAEHTDYTMALIESDSNVVYDGALSQIKGRGNTTWEEAKKPYQIKLDKKTDLLCTGDKANKNKTWVLLANALDKTLVKSAFAYDLAQYLGLAGSPEHRFVDLYFDGEYRGNYFLCEKVQINAGRLEINDLEDVNEVKDETATAQARNRFGNTYQYNPTAVCSSDDFSGGYLLEIDNAFYADENSWFKTKAGYTVVVKSPECATKAQMIYISELFQKAENAARYGTFNGKDVGAYIDLDSLASLYILNEYMNNCDFFNSSTYFFLPESGNKQYEYKFYAGPAWDFDTSLGSRTEYLWMQDPTAITKLDKVFFQSEKVQHAIGEKAQVIDALYDLIFSEEPVTDNAKGISSLTQYRQQILPSSKMNFTIWPFNNTHNTFAYPSYDENCDYTFRFLQERHESVLPTLIALSACKDDDHDHYCDYADCGKRLSECEDKADHNGICDICGATMPDVSLYVSVKVTPTCLFKFPLSSTYSFTPETNGATVKRVQYSLDGGWIWFCGKRFNIPNQNYPYKVRVLDSTGTWTYFSISNGTAVTRQ